MESPRLVCSHWYVVCSFLVNHANCEATCMRSTSSTHMLFSSPFPPSLPLPPLHPLPSFTHHTTVKVNHDACKDCRPPSPTDYVNSLSSGPDAILHRVLVAACSQRKLSPKGKNTLARHPHPLAFSPSRYSKQKWRGKAEVLLSSE